MTFESEELPEALRGLRLQELDIGCSFELRVLPEWLGDMPLVSLSAIPLLRPCVAALYV